MVTKKLKDLNLDPNDLIAKYESLIRLGELTYSSINYLSLKKQSIQMIKKLLDCEFVHIMRLDEETQELYYQKSELNKNGKNFTFEVRLPVDELTFAGACAHLQAVLHIEDIKSDIRYGRLSDSEKNKDWRNGLMIPMIRAGNLLGVIQAVNSNKGKFTEEDIVFSETIAAQFALAVENSILFEKQQQQFLQVVESLADAIVKKDHYTGGHTKRVGVFSEMIALELDLPAYKLSELKLAAILHDVGKIGIEDKILKKDEALTDEEFEIMKDHPRLGHEILAHMDELKDVIDGIRYHHERPDGLGYPYGLKGDEIPQMAMIISVADTFDAMISTRPYRKGLPPMVAYKEIMDHSGTQFHPEVCDAFEKAFKKSNMYKSEIGKKKKKAS
jgi:HD-GYP domain-containing protein (c-di-GMP phosphodiesterase class II)